MSILKFAGLVLLLFVGLSVVIISFQSPVCHVQRSVVIQAPDSVVFDLVNNFQNFNQWSPWYELDPSTAYTFSGPTEGVGARMSWVSENPNVGTGEQWIVESQPHQYVKSGMKFGDFEGEYYAAFDIKPAGTGTEVTWHYHSDASAAGWGGKFMAKMFGMFMDGMIGPDYEKGLANLKTVAEQKN